MRTTIWKRVQTGVAARAWKGSLLHLWRRFEGFGGRNLKILEDPSLS